MSIIEFSSQNLIHYLYYDEDNRVDDIIYSQNNLNKIRTLKKAGEIRVNSAFNSLDLISFNLYKNELYWPFIAIYNDIINPFKLEDGITLDYFKISDFDSLFFDIKEEFNFTGNLVNNINNYKLIKGL